MKLHHLAAIWVLAAAPSLASVKDGVTKWRAGDWKGAVTEWLPYAARGDADAMFNLGQAYRFGRGVPADAAMAQTYFLKAAIKGHPDAQEKLGMTLIAQAATKSEGLRWLTQAAAQDESRSQYALGVAYFNGDGLSANRPLGYAYMRRAEKGKLPEATPALAAMLAKLSPAEKTRGEQLALAPLPSTPQGIATPGAAPAPVATAAAAPPAPTLLAVRDEASIPKGFRIQLGAYPSRAEATENWNNLSPQQKALIGDVAPIVTEQQGIVRLQVGPYPARSLASTLCGKLNALHHDCFVVKG